MKLFGFNITRAQPQVTKSSDEIPLSEAGVAWLRGGNIQTPPPLCNAYQQVVWVYRAVNVLAEQVANTLRSYERLSI